MYLDTHPNSLFLGVDSLGQSMWSCLLSFLHCLQSLIPFLEGLGQG